MLRLDCYTARKTTHALTDILAPSGSCCPHQAPELLRVNRGTSPTNRGGEEGTASEVGPPSCYSADVRALALPLPRRLEERLKQRRAEREAKEKEVGN